jgi:hypothetical protein
MIKPHVHVLGHLALSLLVSRSFWTVWSSEMFYLFFSRIQRNNNYFGNRCNFLKLLLLVSWAHCSSCGSTQSRILFWCLCWSDRDTNYNGFKVILLNQPGLGLFQKDTVDSRTTPIKIWECRKTYCTLLSPDYSSDIIGTGAFPYMSSTSYVTN